MKNLGPLAASHCQSLCRKERGRKRPRTKSQPWGPAARKSLTSPWSTSFPVETTVWSVCGEALPQEVLRGGCRSALVYLAAFG